MMALSPESSFSAPHIDNEHDADSSNVASMVESTPPTTVADTASLHSDVSKHDVITVDVTLPSPVAHEHDEHDLDHEIDHDHELDHDEHTTPELTPAATPAVATPVITPAVTPAPDDAASAAAASAGRGRRSRGGPAPVYNLAKLSGTDGHGKRRSKGDIVSNRHRRRTLGATTTAELSRAAAAASTSTESASASASAAGATIDALNLSWSPKRTQARESPRARRPTIRLSTSSLKLSAAKNKSPASSVKAKAKAAIAKPAVAKAVAKPTIKAPDKPAAPAKRLPRELRRLQDTKEFAHIDEQPVIYTVWAKGKYVNPNEVKEDTPASKRVKRVQETEEQGAKESSEQPVIDVKKRRVKKYLDKGLYAGQETPADITWGLTPAEKKSLSQIPELQPSGRQSTIMPPPMFNGLRTLIAGRDFKLPFQVCNPLPPGQPKPDEWKKMTKNRFVGESREVWRKSPHFHDYQSKCVCTPEDGCTESCQNRIMLYECDEANCNAGREFCQNRAFAELTARRNKGGKYRVGVEVVKTSDRGHGVRSNRCFEPGQIIMEYAGEIITEEECERRMNEVYKDNECYYLMSFDQNMIIDATTGSIARFVNHSCNPNCRMIKWIVSGQPRMALFAGDKPIMTGDELTYDYNFDPFSAKNVQKCLCGEANCRGVLGPKPKAPPVIKNLVSSTVKAGKRKLQEMMGNGAATDDSQPRKKAKALSQAKPITSTRGALASVGMKMSKGTATALKKSISSLASSAKKVTLSKQTGGARQRAKTSAVLKKKTTTTTRVLAYGKKTPAKRTAATKAAKTARVLPKAKGKLPAAPARRPRFKGLPVARKTPFDLMSLRTTETVETEVETEIETEMVLATSSSKTTPKRQSGWAAINLPPREDSDVEHPEITVAHAV